MNKIKKLVEKSAKFAQNLHGTNHDIIYSSFYPAVMNNIALFKQLQQVTKRLVIGFHVSEPMMTSEDFGFFTEKYSGLLFWLGVENGEEGDLHSSKFLPDTRAIQIGIDIFYELIFIN